MESVVLWSRMRMTNILGLLLPKRIFANVRRVIAHSLKCARNENEIKVYRNTVRIPCHPVRELVVDSGIQFIHRPVSRLEFQGEFRVSVHKGAKAVAKDTDRFPVERLEQRNFGHTWEQIQLLRAPRDQNRLI